MAEKSSYHDLIRAYWGYPEFKSRQEEIIQTVLSGKDCLALLPTGGGKSLCYQIPALMRPGLTIVISPLVSLMEDQVNDLQSRKIRAAALHAGVPRKRAQLIIEHCISGHNKILYLAPERLLSRKFKDTLVHLPIKLLVVDEAHCISQWGHDFRPAYLKIAEVKPLFPNVQTLALTGTATPEVRQEILQKLDIPQASVIKQSMIRKNLYLQVIHSKQKIYEAVRRSLDASGSLIIYTRSRRNTLLIRDELVLAGIPAAAYHAGMPHQERNSIQQQWLNNELQGVVATTAFGMGINKRDVRTIIHYDIPENLESYAQEVGRAGRDGKPSICILLVNDKNLSSLTARHEKKYPPVAYIQNIYKHLAHFYQVAKGSLSDEPYPFELELFCRTYQLEVVSAMAAIEMLRTNQYIDVSDGYQKKSQVQVIAEREIWDDLDDLPGQLKAVFQSLLRLYEGILQAPTPINEPKIAKYLDLHQTKLIDAMKRLHQLGFIQYRPANDHAVFRFLTERLGSKDVIIDLQQYQSLKQKKSLQLKAMIEYVQTNRCRNSFIGEYFGESVAKCHNCDQCLQGEGIKDNLKDEILEILKRKSMLLDELVGRFSFSQRSNVLKAIMDLEHENMISMDDHRTISLEH